MKKKVLIIEDERSLANALEEKLKEVSSVEVLHAKNGEEGLKISLSEKPNIILLDLLMPIMDGIQMLKKLREDEWGKEVCVLVITNAADHKHLIEALEAGAYEYLIKSDWSIDKVVNKVVEKIGNC